MNTDKRFFFSRIFEFMYVKSFEVWSLIIIKTWTEHKFKFEKRKREREKKSEIKFQGYMYTVVCI
jgi:hypothetical protein